MGQPYIGEIRIFAGNFPPNGWEFCDGQALPISENVDLFQLIGTTYGGDGEITFNLPDLRGRIPIHMGTGPDGTTFQLGEMAGTETVTLSIQQIPNHNHAVYVPPDYVLAIPCSNVTGTTDTPSPYAFPAVNPFGNMMYSDTNDSEMMYQAVAGGSQPHENMPPFLCVNYIISLYGIFPSPT